MKKVTTLVLAALMSVGIGAAITPAFAESIGACQNEITIGPRGAGQYTDAIDSDAPAIIASLEQKGINVQDVTDWGGCIRADVTKKDGSTAMEFFDPNTLQRLDPNG